MSLGLPITLTEMAVGDGGGALPVPDSDRDALVNEKHRDAINLLSPDEDSPGQYIAEQILAPEVGGWWIRELGLFDQDGTLCYYGNCPETYKPLLAEGSARTQRVRMVIIPNEGLKLELKVDPTVVLATREYVENMLTEVAHRSYVDYRLGDMLTRQEGTAAGIGADLSATNEVEGDLNVLVTPGEYFYASSRTANAPSEYGLLKVWRESKDHVSQICQTREGALASRSLFNNAWSPWRWHATFPDSSSAASDVIAVVSTVTELGLHTPYVHLTRGAYLVWPAIDDIDIGSNVTFRFHRCTARIAAGSADTGDVVCPSETGRGFQAPPFLIRVYSERATASFSFVPPAGRYNIQRFRGATTPFARFGFIARKIY